jgi:hypothetical protein
MLREMDTGATETGKIFHRKIGLPLASELKLNGSQ